MVKSKEKKYLVLFLVVAAVTIILDQITKYIIAVQRPEWKLGFLLIHFVYNTGAGFGLFKEQMGMLAIISALVALAIILFYKRIPKEKIAQVLFGLFLGGVLGNLIDRILRQYVVDFIDVGFWPVFNIADVAISLSVIGLVLYFWKEK